MDALQMFLVNNPVLDITEEVFVSNRFVVDGKAVKFKVRAMTGEEYNDYQNRSVTVGKDGKPSFNQKKFSELVIINNTVVPNFKDAESIKKAGCNKPEEFMYKSLLAGEIKTLADAIASLSGFGSEEENLEEAKN